MASTVIICEDDLIQLQQLESIVRNYSLFHEEDFGLGISTQNPHDVIEFIEKFSTNGGIYFLDIDLKRDTDGIELAREINNIDFNARIIFVTTHDEMAVRAMQIEARAFNFILKDANLESFMETIRKTLVEAKRDIDKSIDSMKKSFNFNIGSRTININFDEILYIRTSDIPHQVNLYTLSSKYSFYANLNSLETKYLKFFRLDRSTMIYPTNIEKIDYSRHDIYFKNNDPIHFSSRKSSKLKKVMSNIQDY